MKKTRILSLAMTGALCLSLLAGCGGGTSETPASETPSAETPAAETPAAPTGAAFKVGGTGPLTGGASIYGLAAQRGAQIAVDEINAEGGAIQFELNYQDDVHVAETAVNAYNTLKGWGMQISLGSVTSTPGLSTAQLAQADRIFTLTPSASAPAVLEGKDCVYQMCFTDDNQGSASAQYIYEQGLGEKVFIIWKNDDVYSTGIKEQFVTEAETLGLNIVGDSTFTEDTQNDFTVQLTDAQQKGADLIFLPMYYQPASLILTQADSMGYEPEFFGVDGMDGILTMENFDASLAEGVMLLTPFNADATDEATVAFVEKYESLYGEYNFDVEKANQLLDEAGYPRGEDGIRFTLGLEASNGRYLMDGDVAQTIASMLEENVGIKVDLQLYDSTTYVNILSPREFKDAALYCFGDNFFDGIYAIACYTPDFSMGETDYNNPVMNDLYTSAMANMDLEERVSQIEEAQQLAAEEVPYANVVNLKSAYGVRDGINFTGRLDEIFNLNTITRAE